MTPTRRLGRRQNPKSSKSAKRATQARRSARTMKNSAHGIAR